MPTPNPNSISEMITVSYPLLAGLPRFGAAFMVLPLVAGKIIPKQIKMGVLIVLVMVAYPHLALSFSVVNWGISDWLLFVVKETFIGALIGYSMAVVLWTMTMIGEMIDMQSGMNNSQIFNPFEGRQSSAFSVLLTQIGVLLFVGFGGLHVFLQLLYESLILWPPASFQPNITGALKDFSLLTSGSMLETSVRLVSPVIYVLLLVEIGIGLLNRAASQLEAFYFSMPIKAVTALLVLVLLLSHLTDVVRQSFNESRQLLPIIDKTLRSK
jgi:type III secretion protein T